MMLIQVSDRRQYRQKRKEVGSDLLHKQPGILKERRVATHGSHWQPEYLWKEEMRKPAGRSSERR